MKHYATVATETFYLVLGALYELARRLMPNAIGNRSPMLAGRTAYLPFHRPEFYELWLQHERNHWMTAEVVMSEDVKDFERLTPEERSLITHVLRFFTQGDIDVAGAYHNVLIPAFSRCHEAVMMMGSIAAREAVHIDAYSKVIESVKLPQTTYNEFLLFKEMKDKHDYVYGFTDTFSYTWDVVTFVAIAGAVAPLLYLLFPLWVALPLAAVALLQAVNWTSVRRLERIAANIALFSGFTEGMQLFSSFAILFSFSKQGKMRGMGTVVEWSVSDETLHTTAMTVLLNAFIDENLDLNDKRDDPITKVFGKWTWLVTGPRGIRIKPLEAKVQNIAREMVELEDAFIDLAFNGHSTAADCDELVGINRHDLKQFIRFISDIRLRAMRFGEIYSVPKNPLPDFEELLNAPMLTNLFEARTTDYAIPINHDWHGKVWGNRSILQRTRAALAETLPSGVENVCPQLGCAERSEKTDKTE